MTDSIWWPKKFYTFINWRIFIKLGNSECLGVWLQIYGQKIQYGFQNFKKTNKIENVYETRY